MAKKQRGKAGRLKSSGPNPNKRAERQTRKALRARRGKKYTDNDFKGFNSALAESGLVLREMKADGNCFFRAISDQLEGIQHNHATFRARVCNHMEEMREFYAPFIEDEDESFDEYMTRMRSDCEWVSSRPASFVSSLDSPLAGVVSSAICATPTPTLVFAVLNARTCVSITSVGWSARAAGDGHDL